MYEIAIRRRTSTLVAVSALVILGAFALMQLPVALLPELERPRLVILARAQQRSREQMLSSVVVPMERRLASISGITSMWSEAEDGEARILLEPSWQTDPGRLRIDAARYVEGAAEIALDELSIKVTGGDPSAIVEVGVLGGPSAADRTEFARKILVPDLARIPGVGRVETIGYSPRRAVVRPKLAALAARGMTVSDLADRLKSAGVSAGAGRVRDGASVLPLVAVERIRNLDDLRAVEVPRAHGTVRLSDVANVDLEEIPEGGLFRLDGEEGVLVRLFRAPHANAVSLAARAEARVAEVAARARGGIRVEVVSDRSGEVKAALEGLAWAAALGVLLGTIVLRAALGRWIPTLALAAVLPASILVTFGAFRIWGIPLDVVSLAGLALAAGMLVDNSIVVLEAIETSRSAGADDPRVDGTRSVATAVSASCVTTIVVFLPLLYIGGLARAFFGEQAFAVAASIAVSLVLSLTLTPALAGKGRVPLGRDMGRRGFERVLSRATSSPVLVVSLAALMAAVAIWAAVGLPRDLLPPGASSVLRADYHLPSDLSVEASRRLSLEIEGRLMATLRAMRLGGAVVRNVLESGSDPVVSGGGSEVGTLEVEFGNPSDARRALPSLTGALNEIPDVAVRSAERPSAFEEAVIGGEDRVEIIATAPTRESLSGLVARVSSLLDGDGGGRLLVPESDRPRAAIRLQWDKQRLAALGLAREATEAQVRASLGGIHAGRVEIEGVEPEILIEPARDQPLEIIPLELGDAAQTGGSRQAAETEPVERMAGVVPLGALARTAVIARPAGTWRLEGRPAARLRPLPGSRLALDVPALERRLRSVPLRQGESVRVGGEAREMAASFGELRLALGLSCVLVYLVIAALYESLLLPLLIMSLLPVAGGGALALLALTGQSLNVMSFMGLIVLGGVAVNNAIVLVDRMEKLRMEGLSSARAACRAASERYRPILMTTSTTLLGMLPLAAVGGAGVELRRALALTVLGGMSASTVAALFVLPVLYTGLARWRTPAGEAPIQETES